MLTVEKIGGTSMSQFGDVLNNIIKKHVKPGSRIFIQAGCSEPIDLTKKLIKYGPRLPDVEIFHALSISDIDYYATAGGMEDLFRYNAFFIGRSLRNYVMKGQADYTPMLLSEVPKIFKTGQIHLDIDSPPVPRWRD